MISFGELILLGAVTVVTIEEEQVDSLIDQTFSLSFRAAGGGLVPRSIHLTVSAKLCNKPYPL